MKINPKTYFDIRTKFLILMIASVLTVSIHSFSLFISLIALLGIYLGIQGQWRFAFKSAATIIVGISLLEMPYAKNHYFSVISIMIAFIIRLMPLAMASKPLFQENPSKVIAAFESINMPRQLALPLTFMLRFYPTVKYEFLNIRNALKLRNLITITKPLVLLEYTITPLLITCATISDQLSAAAEVRGISNPKLHTSIRKLKFEIRDYTLIIIALILTIALIAFDRRGVAL